MFVLLLSHKMMKVEQNVNHAFGFHFYLFVPHELFFLGGRFSLHESRVDCKAP